MLAAKTIEGKAALFKEYMEEMGAFGFKAFLAHLYECHFNEGIFKALYTLIQNEGNLNGKKSILMSACLFYDLSKVDIDHELISKILKDFKFADSEVNQCLGFL